MEKMNCLAKNIYLELHQEGLLSPKAYIDRENLLSLIKDFLVNEALYQKFFSPSIWAEMISLMDNLYIQKKCFNDVNFINTMPLSFIEFSSRESMFDSDVDFKILKFSNDMSPGDIISYDVDGKTNFLYGFIFVSYFKGGVVKAVNASNAQKNHYEFSILKLDNKGGTKEVEILSHIRYLWQTEKKRMPDFGFSEIKQVHGDGILELVHINSHSLKPCHLPITFPNYKKLKLAYLRIRPLLEYLEWLHSKEIYHLDLSPSNVLVSPNGLKLIDFGSSFVPGLQEKNLPFTPMFSAPERLGSPPNKAMDIYSLGALVHYYFTGETLHSANQSWGLQSSKLMPLERSLRKAASADPSYRYSNVLEMRNDIDSAFSIFD